MLAAGAGVTVAAAQPKAAKNPIVLHVDMQVDSAKEKEMVNHYHATST